MFITNIIITPVIPNRDENPIDQKLSGILIFITVPIRFIANSVQIPCTAVKKAPKTNFLFFISNTDCAKNKTPNSKIKIAFPEFIKFAIRYGIYVNIV